jgi:hypothetical protein
MREEHRKSSRKSTYAPAYLYTEQGLPLGKCFVRDVSDSGARLVYSATDELPSALLVTIGRLRKHCRLIWRHDNEIGIRFFVSQSSNPP